MSTISKVSLVMFFIVLANSSRVKLGCSPFNTNNTLNKVCTLSSHVGSTCYFYCPKGYYLMGKSYVTCGSTSKWSNKPPVCKCPPCTTGPSCQQSISYKKLSSKINDIPWGTFQALYAHYPIKCRINKAGGIFNFNWQCTCTDLTFNKIIKCGEYKSPRGSCSHTLSALVKMMVKAGVYPQPCDEGAMKIGC